MSKLKLHVPADADGPPGVAPADCFDTAGHRALDALEENQVFGRHHLTAGQFFALCMATAPELYTEPPRALIATAAVPGSDEKIAVMADRLALGLRIFCPFDLDVASFREDSYAWQIQGKELSGAIAGKRVVYRRAA